MYIYVCTCVCVYDVGIILCTCGGGGGACLVIERFFNHYILSFKHPSSLRTHALSLSLIKTKVPNIINLLIYYTSICYLRLVNSVYIWLY